MKIFDETFAEGSFRLLTDDSKTRSKYTHYRVSFTSEEGEKSELVETFRIRVTPDLAPEVSIISPESKNSEVAQNNPFQVLVRALDPDYLISDVRIRAELKGTRVFESSLISAEQRREIREGVQITSKFEFVPTDFRLNVGDVLNYVVIAEDNRQSPISDIADPNVSRTEL